MDMSEEHTVYPKKYAHGFCFAVLCCGYTLTDIPISIRHTSLALWQSNDCPGASKATLMNMDKYFMWIHYERLHNHNKAKHNKTVCIFLGKYSTLHIPSWTSSQQDLHQHRVTLSRPILRLLHQVNVLPVTFAVRRLSIAHRFCREEVAWHAVNFYCNLGNTLERRCTLYTFVQHVSVTKGFTVALFNIVIAWSLLKISWFLYQSYPGR